MFGSLAYWDILQRIFINTIISSIPEEFYIVMFTLILMGEFEYWTEAECTRLFGKEDYIRVFFPVVISAFFSNVLRYSGLDTDLVSVLSILSIFVLIVLYGNIWHDASALKWIGKAFVFVLLGSLTVMVIEFIYIPFVIYGTGKSMIEINNNVWLNFVVALPERIVEAFILLFFIAKKRTLLKANIVKPVFESKILMCFIFSLLTINIVFILIIGKTVAYQKVLIDLPANLRIVIILGICIFPLTNIFIFLWSIYYIKDKELQKRKSVSDKISSLLYELNEIKTFSKNKNYDNIEWKIKGIERDIEEISGSLFGCENSVKRG